MKKVKCAFVISIMLISLSIILSPVSAAADYYVSTAGDDCTGDGSSANPWLTIQHAIDNVADGATIHLGPGTYYEEVKIGSSPIYDKDIVIVGADPYDPSKTVVSGDTDNNGVADARPFYIYSGGHKVSITGITITDGKSSTEGGGMYCFWSTVSLSNCVFINNTGRYGGALYNYESLLTITNCIFQDNTSDDRGGAIYNENDELCAGESVLYYERYPIITNCTFTGNVAKGDSTSHTGGAIHNEPSSPTITNCIFWRDTDYGMVEIFDENGSSSDVTYCDVDGGLAGTGNIDADPLFMNPSAGNLSLSLLSPCINAGRDTSGAAYGNVTDSISGIARPQETAYDMGAYEVASSPILWSPVSVQPLVSTLLDNVNSSWKDIELGLSSSEDSDLLAMADMVQEHISKASTVANPIAACGGLYEALRIMEAMASL